ncbi:MAG TPA: class I SAM-dependent methyltransferase [Pyrinomonadaceae bacterium]
MGREVDLTDLYPKSKRTGNVGKRATLISDEMREVSRQFGYEYFDGNRMYGYGGYNYHPRFWQGVVRRIRDYYELADDASLLDVGCAKGFMLHDFKELLPNLSVAGIDISEYAIENALADVKPYLRVGNAKELPYEDNSFDLVLSINTIHNLPLEECKQALREIERVSRKHAFVQLDAYRTEEQKQRLEEWVLTCKTYMHVEEWKELFKEIGYTGDYYWFIAE